MSVKQSITQSIFRAEPFPPIYEVLAVPFVAAANAHMGLTLQRFLKPGDKALDLGTGTGMVARYLAANFQVEVTAVDSSSAMLQWARMRNGVSYIQGSAEALPSAVGGPFDLVVASYLFRHLEPDQAPKVFQEVARVIRPGGLWIITDLSLPLVGPMGAQRQVLGIWSLYNPELLKKLGKETGFSFVSASYPPLSIQMIFKRA